MFDDVRQNTSSSLPEGVSVLLRHVGEAVAVEHAMRVV